MEMAIATGEPVKAEEKAERNGTSYNDEKHPYMTPEFWLDPINQFWNKSSIFKKEMYEHILDDCRKELKPDLIS